MNLAMHIFGGGRGMLAPDGNQRFYWLVDLNSRNQKGRWYTFSAGFGAQLSSFEMRRPAIGEERRFGELRFVPFTQSRGYIRDPIFDCPIIPMMWRISWACKNLGQNATAQDIRNLESKLVY